MNPYQIIERYYQPGSELYGIFVSHAESVQKKAIALAQNNPSLNLDMEFLSEASLLHDLGIYLTYAPEIYCLGSRKYIEHGYLGADILRQLGYEKHALVCERHTGTGLSLEYIINRDLPLPHRDLTPQSLEEQLICYADKFYSKTNLECEKSIEYIRAKLQKRGDDSLATFDRWVELFGV